MRGLTGPSAGARGGPSEVPLRAQQDRAADRFGELQQDVQERPRHLLLPRQVPPPEERPTPQHRIPPGHDGGRRRQTDPCTGTADLGLFPVTTEEPVLFHLLLPLFRDVIHPYQRGLNQYVGNHPVVDEARPEDVARRVPPLAPLQRLRTQAGRRRVTTNEQNVPVPTHRHRVLVRVHQKVEKGHFLTRHRKDVLSVRLQFLPRILKRVILKHGVQNQHPRYRRCFLVVHRHPLLGFAHTHRGRLNLHHELQHVAFPPAFQHSNIRPDGPVSDLVDPLLPDLVPPLGQLPEQLTAKELPCKVPFLIGCFSSHFEILLNIMIPLYNVVREIFT